MESLERTVTVDMLVAEYKRPITVDQNGCWNWMGSISSQGYGIYNHKLVHGLVYSKYKEPSLQGKVIRHKCNNKKCVNLYHLVEGTFTDNAVDAVLAGDRGKVGKEGYEQMSNMYYKQGMSQVDIAKSMGVSRSLVSYFFKGKMMTFKPTKPLRRI